MLNLENYQGGAVAPEQLALEDRWILSRLTSVTQQVTTALGEYRYSEAARRLYDFCWDEFCSSYIEMVKCRFQDPGHRAVAQRVSAYALDVILRLLHPMIPFITEEIWQLLSGIAAERGLTRVATRPERLISAPWPEVHATRLDEKIEAQFELFQAVLSALREIRSRQNVAPRRVVSCCVTCDAATARLLSPLADHFLALAQAQVVAVGEDVSPPRIHAALQRGGLQVFVDLEGLIDVGAELQRLGKQRERLATSVAGKEKKLSNRSFVDRAPADVVQRERDALEQLRGELEKVVASLEALGGDGR
jgi:valyl-tRNA synthetase